MQEGARGEVQDWKEQMVLLKVEVLINNIAENCNKNHHHHHKTKLSPPLGLILWIHLILTLFLLLATTIKTRQSNKHEFSQQIYSVPPSHPISSHSIPIKPGSPRPCLPTSRCTLPPSSAIPLAPCSHKGRALVPPSLTQSP